MTDTDPTTPPAGDPQTEPTNSPPPPALPDEPLREPGKKALEEERARVKALEKKLAALAPLEQIADLLGGKPTGDAKTDLEQLTERLGKHEEDLAAEKVERWRAEVRADKGLTAAQAARLVGSTKEELTADADALLALFPAADLSKPRTPAPDPSQGSKGNPPPSLDAQIREAEAKGDTKTAILLKARKLTEQNK